MISKTCTDSWLGTVTVGERGQIVIPAEARKKLDISAGDTLIASYHPNGEGLMLFKVGAMRDFLNHLSAGLTLAEQTAVDSSDQAENTEGV